MSGLNGDSYGVDYCAVHHLGLGCGGVCGVEGQVA